MDLLLNTQSNDAVWVNGPLTKEYNTQPFTQTVEQRLRILLQTFLEEWFWDTTYGIPYFQRILAKKNISKSAVDLIFQTKILEEIGVKEIIEFQSTFVNRQYNLTFRVKVVTGETTAPIVINPIN